MGGDDVPTPGGWVVGGGLRAAAGGFGGVSGAASAAGSTAEPVVAGIAAGAAVAGAVDAKAGEIEVGAAAGKGDCLPDPSWATPGVEERFWAGAVLCTGRGAGSSAGGTWATVPANTGAAAGPGAAVSCGTASPDIGSSGAATLVGEAAVSMSSAPRGGAVDAVGTRSMLEPTWVFGGGMRPRRAGGRNTGISTRSLAMRRT